LISPQLEISSVIFSRAMAGKVLEMRAVKERRK
jgi:hypothetical protein